MAESKSTKSTKKPKKVSTKEAESKKSAKSTASEKKKNSNSTGIVIGLILGLLAIGGIVTALLCLNKGTEPDDPKAKITYADAFFIYDYGKYTLWNSEGKRLTEDDYSYASSFLGGYAYIKKGGQSGIIDSAGKMTVELGKYGEISNKGGLYLAQDGNTKEYSLITGTGQELLKGQGLEASANSSTGGFAIAKLDGKNYVYTYNGKLIASVDVNDDAGNPESYSSNDFGDVCYDEKSWIFDVRSGQTLATFEGDCYSISSVSKDRTKILLESEGESEGYKLITNSQVYDLNEVENYAITYLGDVIGYDDYYDIALLDEDYKVAKHTSSDLALKDYKNYATINDDNEVEVYRNGEKLITFSEEADLASGVMFEDYYAIRNDGHYKFYNLDGTVAIDHEYYDIDSMFDENHLAIVADAFNEYYLINTKGERIGDWTAKKIVSQDGGYQLRNDEGKYAIANKQGEIVTEFKYDALYYRSNAVEHNIWTGRYDENDYDIIDVDAKKILLEHANTQNVSANYFSVRNDDDDVEYYTFTGEKFYTTGQ